MIVLVAIVGFVALAWQLRVERARVTELLALLEAKAAPAEYAAYARPQEPEAQPTWLTSEDGLVSFALDEA